MLSMTLLIGQAAWADTSAFTSGGYLTNQPPSFTGTRGWDFFNNSPYGSSNYMAVTQLGVFDQGGDGLANAHEIGIWAANGTLLASTTIPAGTVAPLVDGYRYMPITPVLLPPSAFPSPHPFIVAVAAAYLAGDADDLVTPQYGGLSDLVFLSSYDGSNSHGFVGGGPGLPFPGGHFVAPEGSGSPALLEVNFQFNIIQVPEPSIWLLLAPGLLYLSLRQRQSLLNK